MDTAEDKISTSLADFLGVLEALAYLINKISFEVTFETDLSQLNTFSTLFPLLIRTNALIN